ncbi:MAG TPA: butyrate kinase [Symbiobacteriaceae bacterium]|nr:butyrate kinase [Symbiobacteriaceae bacterium]
MTSPEKLPLILAINPGATSTKIGLLSGSMWRLRQTIPHDASELAKYDRVTDQYQYRLDLVRKALNDNRVSPEDLTAVVARGGLLRPCAGGTYLINQAMLNDLEACTYGAHVSNLAPIIAYNIAHPLGIPSYIVDPVTVDEFWPLARVSGLKGITRLSQAHALNMKAVAHRVAKSLGFAYSDLNLITVHLGSGISVAPHCKGRMVDVNNANNEGPFAPERCGGLPAVQLTQLCFSGKYTEKQVINMLTRDGGLYSYLGTKDVRIIEERIAAGDQEAKLVLDAMCYQVAKEVGAMACALEGKVDRIIITGGIAYSDYVVSRIVRRVEFLAPISIVPGEEELESLVEGALRVLNGEEQPREYPPQEEDIHAVAEL